MSSYISASQVPRSVPEPQKFIPFLWNGPEFSLQHRIFPSEHELGQLIMDSFEISNSSGATMSYPILPFGGLRAVFLFNRGLTRAELCGPTTLLKKLSLPPQSSVFCMRFLPGSMRYFSPLSACELAGQSQPLSQYLSHSDNLSSAMRRGESFHARNVLLVRTLCAGGAARFQPFPLIGQSVGFISEHRGIVRVSQIAAEMGCSERYLSRMFQEHIGISASFFVNRFSFNFSCILSWLPSRKS
ncbi:hypothetical protein [Oscillibacter sp.]|uniref:hypothetical protein n=1 Tax=Oscillibacter sp. TaxID=1945593 RepID=UPI003398D293